MKIKFKIMSFIYVTFLAFALVSCDTNTENSNESEAVDNTVTTDATKETEEEKQEETEEEIQEETQEDILNIDTNSEEYIAILDYFETVRETKWTRKSAIEYFTDNGISKEVIEYIIENEQTMDWNDSISYFYNSGILEGVSSKELIELFRKELFTEEEIQYAIDNASVITQEHINAYKSAKTYAQMMNMSKQGVYDQITSSFGDNFSPEVAQLAVEYLDVDWNKNALESAKTYYNLMQMSSQAVYEQLVSPYGGQFTEEEAQYAIDALLGESNSSESSENTPSETNENTSSETSNNTTEVSQEFKNALSSAETYSNMMHMSKQAIYDQLTSPYGGGFQSDAAQYAVDNVNADWNKNALESAKTYYNTMGMSSQAVYEQLVSPYGGQFTKEEAQYAIDNLSN